MDKLNFVRNGMSRLPPGFRFEPTEEELVFQYLKCKVFSSALPASIIPEINVCNYDPWDLPGGEMEEERYFFSKSELAKYRNGNGSKRLTPSGYWKATGSDKTIGSSTSTNTVLVGLKKTLVFYARKPQAAGYSRTPWIMHEYRLVSTLQTSKPNVGAGEMEKWVLCRIIISKKMRVQHHQNDRVLAESGLYEFTRDTASMSSTASSSSSSSNDTEITSRTSAAAHSHSDDFSSSTTYM